MAYNSYTTPQASHYAAPPAYYTPSTQPHPNPSTVQITQYQPAFTPYGGAEYQATSTPYGGAEYQAASTAYGGGEYPAVGGEYQAASSGYAGGEYQAATYAYNATSASTSLSKPKPYYGKNTVAATRYRPGLGFKEHDLASKKLKLLQGGTKADSVRVCTTCNVICNSDKVFATHVASAKHIAKVSGVPSSQITGPNPKKKKKKVPKLNVGPKVVAQSVYCEICKITCNTLDMYNKHVSGKKHNKRIKDSTMAIINTINNPPAAPSFAKAIQFVPASNNTDNNEGNILNQNVAQSSVNNAVYNAVQSVYCEVCKITCNTQEVYNNHINGKKHTKNLTSQTTGVNDEGNDNGQENVSENKRKVASLPNKEDLEVKKRKLVENGTNTVKVCELCNVVCNSQKVFDFHVMGKMHINMLKKQEENNQPIGPPSLN